MRIELIALVAGFGLAVLIACGGGSRADTPIVDEPKDLYCQSLKELPERGLACLHCNHPKARIQSLVLSNVLLRSCLDKPVISWLIDGSFGFDPEYMASEIDKLTLSQRTPTVIFYLYNGASQRKYKTTDVPGFETNTEPSRFRHNIQHDGATRDAYRQMIAARVPLFEHAVNAGARVILVVGLEDNLNDTAFDSLLALTREVVGALPVEYARNPCKSCYPGNEGGIPAGVIEEKHTAGIAYNNSGIVTNDGQCFKFDAEQPSDKERTLDDLAESRDRAGEIGAVYALWSGRRQGLTCKDNRPAGYASPDDRLYATPNEAEQTELIRFLVN